VQGNISRLLGNFEKTLQPELLGVVSDLASTPGTVHRPPPGNENWPYQAAVLTQRTFINFVRNVSVFWLRLAMYLMLCICIGARPLARGQRGPLPPPPRRPLPPMCVIFTVA